MYEQSNQMVNPFHFSCFIRGVLQDLINFSKFVVQEIETDSHTDVSPAGKLPENWHLSDLEALLYFVSWHRETWRGKYNL